MAIMSYAFIRRGCVKTISNAPRRGKLFIAQGNALGKKEKSENALKGQKY